MTQAPTTHDEQMDLYRDEQKALAKKYRYFYELLRGAFVVAVFVVIGVFLFTDDLLPEYVANVYVTVVGAIATIVILDRRDEERLTRQRKQELFLQLGSQSNDFALEAKRQLEQLGWLEEALKQKRFPFANWQGMILRDADLTSAALWYADLTSTKLEGAKLTSANLSHADLTSTNLNCANLTSAVLRGTRLRSAVLVFANLTSAILVEANLTSAILVEADFTKATFLNTRFDEKTVLPDRTHWTPDTDMRRFTDPNHPQFWRSDEPWSPAYKGRAAGDDEHAWLAAGLW